VAQLLFWRLLLFSRALLSNILLLLLFLYNLVFSFILSLYHLDFGTVYVDYFWGVIHLGLVDALLQLSSSFSNYGAQRRPAGMLGWFILLTSSRPFSFRAIEAAQNLDDKGDKSDEE
jgi:hypothetical protein